MSLRLALYDSWTPDLTRPWERVLEQDSEAGVFGHPAWQQAWWESLGDGDLLVALVFDGDAPVAVYPACRDQSDPKLLTLLGSEDVTDEQVPVAVDGREAESLEFLLRWAFADAGFSRLRFHSVLHGHRWLDVVGEVCASARYGLTREEVDVAPVIELPSSFDEYLASLSGHDRHELRRKRRRLGEAGEWRIRRADEVGWESDLAAFFDFHRQAPGEKAGFFTPERERFFRRLAADLFLFGLARLDVLDLDGEPVACTFSYDYRGTLALYNSSFRADLQKLAPGMVLVGSLIEESIESGHHTFDFLRGAESYKYRFGAKPRPVLRVEISASMVP